MSQPLVSEVELPARARRLSTLARVDYTDAFLLDTAFAPKPAYADVRCRLADPQPAIGSRSPVACPAD
jgi:hypothetical protein